MKKGDVVQYLMLDEKFQKRCGEVCNIFSKIRPEWKHMDTFTIIDMETIEATGEENWAYGGHESYYCKIPTKFLWMSNEELEAMVEREYKAIEEAKQKSLQDKEDRERQEYERLKQKFEGNH